MPETIETRSEKNVNLRRRQRRRSRRSGAVPSSDPIRLGGRRIGPGRPSTSGHRGDQAVMT
jgi:hypothetical protein